LDIGCVFGKVEDALNFFATGAEFHLGCPALGATDLEVEGMLN
jgi:hypothetical protein